MATNPIEEMNTQACNNLKACMQLMPGSQIRHGKLLSDVHQAVFDVTGNGVTILGVEIWNEVAGDVIFVPWHAVDMVIPPDPDEFDE